MADISSATRKSVAGVADDTIADLHRLVEALDRRLPRFEQAGEAQIARDAAELRQKAIALIARLAREMPLSGH
jgi:hypothetical protein